MNIPEGLTKRLAEARAKSEKPPYVITETEIVEQSIYMIENGYRDDVDPKAFRNLARYLIAKMEMQTKKGLCLYGNNGTGKTTFMRMFCGARTLNASDISDIFTRNGQRDALEVVLLPKEYDVYPSGYFNLNIDDMGAEKALNEYGIKYEPMALVIEKMYNRFFVGFGKYNITTNLTKEQISERYGQRIASRMAEMFYFVPFTGKDNRLEEF